MKIYLDIDETLIDNRLEKNEDGYMVYKPVITKHLKEFLEHILENHDVYWLTTHCNGDATTAVSYMAEVVPYDIIRLIMKIKPTKWNLCKSEAINMEEDFLWFEDAPSWNDLDKLKKYNKMDSLVRVNLDEDPDVLGRYLKV